MNYYKPTVEMYKVESFKGETDRIYVKWDDVKQFIPETPPVTRKDKCVFNVGDVVKYCNGICSGIEYLEVTGIEFNPFLLLFTNAKEQINKRVHLDNCVLATPEERAKFMDEKWSRKIGGDVKVRAFRKNNTIYFMFKLPNEADHKTDGIGLYVCTGEAICKALDIPICEGEPVYPL